MHARTAWQALAQRPLGFVTTLWPWRSLAYLVSGVLLGVTTFFTLFALATAGVLLLLVLVGVVGLVGLILSGIVVARFERWRLRLVDRDPAPDPHRPPDQPGLRGWLRFRLREPATWRELGFTALSLVGLWWMDLVVLGFAFGLPVGCFEATLADPTGWTISWAFIGLAMLSAAPYTITAWAGARAALTRAILAPRNDELGAELVELTRSRARLVDAFEVERRRIERDLHDGAQQRLVSLSVLLGMTRLDTVTDSEMDRQLVKAQDQVNLTLRELRDLIRDVHPQVLVDHGLRAAIEEVASRTVVNTTVDIQLPHRLPAPLELTAYFVINEALANIAKHSQAQQASVGARLHTDLLVLEIRDDGIGGADPTAGTGLTGLADRLAVVEGRLRISSPPGGPTLLHVEIPCH